MADLIFATPWWLLASLAVLGAVLFWSGNKSQQANVRNSGIGLVCLVIALGAISYFVVTDKEKVTRQSLELVSSVQHRDWSKFDALLDEDVSLDTQGGTLFTGRDALMQGAKRDADTYALTNITGRVSNVVQDKLGITVDLDVWSEQSVSMGMRVPSSWRLVWQRTNADWLLHEVTCLRIGNEGSNGSISRLIGK